MSAFKNLIVVSVAFAGLVIGGCASVSHLPAAPETLPMSSPITITQVAEAPSGLVDFCRRNLDLCHDDVNRVSASPASGGQTRTPDHTGVIKHAPITRKPQPTVVRLTPALIAHLRSINVDVNNAITPISDLRIHGKEEHWSLPLTSGSSRYGDCEEYAMEKRIRLIASGIDPASLFLSVVTSERSGRHLVLVISTDRGDYVLDNMRPEILGWQDAGYQWISRQSSANLLSWAHIALAQSVANSSAP